MTTDIKARLRRHLADPDSFETYDNAEVALFGMFGDAVPAVFTWSEGDYQGTAMAVYAFEGRYVYGVCRYGSCSGCDSFVDEHREGRLCALNLQFDAMEVADSLQDVRLGDYPHPDLVAKWNACCATKNV